VGRAKQLLLHALQGEAKAAAPGCGSGDERSEICIMDDSGLYNTAAYSMQDTQTQCLRTGLNAL
jgi:hypothetical protein